VEYTQLGRTQLRVSRLSFGTAPLGGLFGPVEERQALRLVDEAIALGINFLDTSPYYGSAEYRLGLALKGRRDEIVLGTKAGQLGDGSFDFSPAGIRSSVERSLRLLGTDHVDILQLHDVEYVPLEGPLHEGYETLVGLRDEGKARYVGMTGYPLATMRRALTETDLDVLLTYAHGTLLDNSISDELGGLATERGTGLINAAAVALGLLTPAGTSIAKQHPATRAIREAAASMVARCAEHGVDPAFVANQYSTQRSGCATTVIGTAKSRHLAAAVEAAETPLDEDLVAELVALRPPVGRRQWTSGLPDNN
jgi:L-galactose dehydrogenase